MKTMKLWKKVVLSVVSVLLAAVIVTLCVLLVPVRVSAGNSVFEKGWATDNNGYAKDGPDVERLISVLPTELQVQYSDMGYYSFIHYGMNTFTGQEWGTGEEDPSQFCPTTVDTDQWVRVLKEAGSKGIIFTVKHHDGFSL